MHFGMEHVITMRYPALCSMCGTGIEPGLRAAWDRDSRVATCEACVYGTADPYAAPMRNRPGASALREGERRRNGETWTIGGEAERTVGNLLNGMRGVLALHDRQMPGSKANIDHVAVAPSGVWVIDTKRYTGRVERNHRRGGRLEVAGRNRTKLVEQVHRQVGVVTTCLDGLGIPIQGVLCFVDGRLPFLMSRFKVDGVMITTPEALERRIMRSGPLSPEAMRAAHDTLDLTFRPA
jgi:hypothetical protein